MSCSCSNGWLDLFTCFSGCLLLQALETKAGGSSLAARLELLSGAVTQLVMDHVSQALFNADRLALGMHMAHNLAPHMLQPQDWDIFLGNSVSEGELPKPLLQVVLCLYQCFYCNTIAGLNRDI